MQKRSSLVVFAGFVLLAGVVAVAQEGSPYEQRENLIYAEVHGIGLLMDVFTPTGPRNGLGIVDVASGAWHSDRGKINDHKEAGMYDVFCGKGYTVFAVRPGSVSKWRGQEMLAHVQKGIRYVKQHAEEYGIDPGRLGMLGASAGGHLATLAAVTGEDGDPDAKDPLARHSTRVKAVAVFFPPTDFTDWDGGKPNFARIGALLFAGGIKGKTDEEVLAKAKQLSPRHQPLENAPPFLFIHGDADPLVPLQQSETMVAALRKAGISAELIVKEGGTHPWPTIPVEVAVMADWFDKQLAE